MGFAACASGASGASCKSGTNGRRRVEAACATGRLELEPEEVTCVEREQVRQLADLGEGVAAPQLDRAPTAELAEIQLHVLRVVRHVVHAEDDFVLVATEK